MPLRIRLRRVGRKKQPYYRVVVANSEAPRDGSYVDEVGFYNPRTRPALLRLDLEKVDAWLGRGAEATTSAASLIRKARKGGDEAVQLTQPGEEGSQKTSAVPERRPTSRAAARPEAEPASSGEEPTAETVATADPQVDAAAEQKVDVPSGVEATTEGEKADAALASREGPTKEVVGDLASTPESQTEEPAAAAPAEPEAEAGEGKAEVSAAVEPAEAAEAAEEETKAQAEAEAPEAQAEEPAGAEAAAEEPAEEPAEEKPAKSRKKKADAAEE